MNDVDFLCWIHERLVNVHGEDPLFDYMHRLRDIIANTPQEQRSVAKVAANNLEELRMYLTGGIK